MTINDTQDAIIDEFASLGGDKVFETEYLVDLGKRLGPLKPEHKIPANLVKGCQSEVHLVAEVRDNRVLFSADSNTQITKGLVSLLIRIFSGQYPDDIMNADLYFMKAIGMERFVGTQRTGGFSAMIKQMKIYALAFKLKEEVRS